MTLASLAGCASAPVTDQDWPQGIPPRPYYEALYETDAANQAAQTRDVYTTWVVRFYMGWEGYPRGWQDISREASTSMPPDRREAVRAEFYRVGKLISGEWAKDSLSRVIFTQTIAAWGDALFEAVQREEVETLIERVGTDVEDLLAGQLDPAAITAERYYPDPGEGLPFEP